jgi:hypothetical protein
MANGVTDADGRVQLRDMGFSAITLTVRHPAYVIERREIALTAATTEITIDLSRGFTLTGKVHMSAEWLAGGSNQMTLSTHASSRADARIGRIGADGALEVAALAAGTYTWEVTLRSRAGSLRWSGDVEIHNDAWLDVHPPATEPCRVRLVGWTRPATQLQLWFIRVEQPLSEIQFSARVTPGESTSLVVPVPAGRYVAYMMWRDGRDDRESWRPNFELLEGTETVVDIGTGEGQIRIVDEAGGSIPGAMLAATLLMEGDAQPVAVRDATTPDESGEFVLHGLAPGKYTLHALAPGHAARRMVVQIRAGEPLVMTLTLPRAVALSITSGVAEGATQQISNTQLELVVRDGGMTYVYTESLLTQAGLLERKGAGLSVVTGFDGDVFVRLVAPFPVSRIATLSLSGSGASATVAVEPLSQLDAEMLGDEPGRGGALLIATDATTGIVAMYWAVMPGRPGSITMRLPAGRYHLAAYGLMSRKQYATATVDLGGTAITRVQIGE